jgi:hypothetical protein
MFPSPFLDTTTTTTTTITITTTPHTPIHLDTSSVDHSYIFTLFQMKKRDSEIIMARDFEGGEQKYYYYYYY